MQPGIVIDYATGESYEGGIPAEEPVSGKTILEETYILNISSKKFHRPDCSSVREMKEQNREEYAGSREELISRGYAPCKSCNP